MMNELCTSDGLQDRLEAGDDQGFYMTISFICGTLNRVWITQHGRLKKSRVCIISRRLR